MKHLVILLFVLLKVPFLWADEEVSFKSGDVVLSGTLLTPSGKGPFPVVIFVHGSGPEGRSNSKARAKIFVRHGYAAFIYDKRGVDKSGGDPDFHTYFSFDVLADDVIAAIEHLTSYSFIDQNKIGLVAASQGGWVAPLAASKCSKIKFMIVMSGSVSTVGEDNLFERNARLKKEGFTEEEILEVTEMHLVDQEVSRSGNEFDKFSALWNRNKGKRWFKRVYLSENPTPVDHRYRKWYKTVVDFDPQVPLAKLGTPVLWLYGDPALDAFCPVELSVERLKKLKEQGKDYQIKTLEKADHSLTIKSKDACCDELLFEWLHTKI